MPLTCKSIKCQREQSSFTANESSITQEWMVIFDAATATPLDCRDAKIMDGTTVVAKLPQVGDEYADDTNIYAKSVTSTRHPEDPKVWTASVQFTSNVPADLVRPEGATKWRVDFSSRGIPFEEELTTDFSDASAGDKSGVHTLEYTDGEFVVTFGAGGAKAQAIVNTAGDPIEPKLTGEYNDEELTFRFRTNAVDWANIAACRGKVNKDGPITITIKGQSRTFAKYTLKLVDATIDIAYENGVAVWDVVYVLHYRADTWVTLMPNVGFHTATLHTDTGGIPYVAGLIRIYTTDEMGKYGPKPDQSYLSKNGVAWFKSPKNATGGSESDKAAVLGFWRCKKCTMAPLFSGLTAII